jgi:hypothetical protein
MRLQALNRLFAEATLVMCLGDVADSGPLSHMRKVFKSTKSSISPRVVGFQLVRQDVLDASDLSSSCASTLAKAIDCDEHVAGLGERQYHGSLEDDDLTKAICSTTCQNALKAAEHRINGACASTPELFPGIPVVSLLYAVISGWNETCLQDPDSGINCNGKFLPQTKASSILIRWS